MATGYTRIGKMLIPYEKPDPKLAVKPKPAAKPEPIVEQQVKPQAEEKPKRRWRRKAETED